MESWLASEARDRVYVSLPPFPVRPSQPRTPGKSPQRSRGEPNRILRNSPPLLLASQPGCPASVSAAGTDRSDRARMSYAYLFKYIIIGDTGPSRSPFPLPNPPLLLRSPRGPRPGEIGWDPRGRGIRFSGAALAAGAGGYARR